MDAQLSRPGDVETEMDTYVDLTALGQVLGTSILAGAGLVAAFAAGLAGLSVAGAGGPHGQVAPARRLAGWGLAAAAFAVLAVGVVLGLYAMFSKPA
jgi:hypothetical protein